MQLVFAGLVVALALLAALGAFLPCQRRLLRQVLSGSEITATASGMVEFVRVGTGPVILQVHGGATGYDPTLALNWNLQQAGFSILTPSRPGYVRTPLATGPAPEQAADALASLLDVLGLQKAAVMGTSGGGQSALQFALRHPDRLWCLVLQSGVTQRFIEPHRSTHSLLGRAVFSRSGQWLSDLGLGRSICSGVIGRVCSSGRCSTPARTSIKTRPSNAACTCGSVPRS